MFKLKNIKIKTLHYIIFGCVIFLALIYFNYTVARKNIQNGKSAEISTTLFSYPEAIGVDSKGLVMWSVQAPPDLKTDFTTIYYGQESSPSALTKFDSPQAVNYPYRLEEYTNGSFKLPDTFDAHITFDKPGIIYFRSYAKVGRDHLWSEEKSITVNNK